MSDSGGVIARLQSTRNIYALLDQASVLSEPGIAKIKKVLPRPRSSRFRDSIGGKLVF